MSGFADDRPHLAPPVEQAKRGRASTALTNRREGSAQSLCTTAGIRKPRPEGSMSKIKIQTAILILPAAMWTIIIAIAWNKLPDPIDFSVPMPAAI